MVVGNSCRYERVYVGLLVTVWYYFTVLQGFDVEESICQKDYWGSVWVGSEEQS